MRNFKFLVLCGLIISLAFLLIVPLATEAGTVLLGGKKTITGPNQWDCDCTENNFINCKCLIQLDPD
jgi:hypothetical protein